MIVYRIDIIVLQHFNVLTGKLVKSSNSGVI